MYNVHVQGSGFTLFVNSWNGYLRVSHWTVSGLNDATGHLPKNTVNCAKKYCCKGTAAPEAYAAGVTPRVKAPVAGGVDPPLHWTFVLP